MEWVKEESVGDGETAALADGRNVHSHRPKSNQKREEVKEGEVYCKP